jgi:hypothetical protein
MRSSLGEGTVPGSLVERRRRALKASALVNAPVAALNCAGLTLELLNYYLQTGLDQELPASSFRCRLSRPKSVQFIRIVNPQSPPQPMIR